MITPTQLRQLQVIAQQGSYSAAARELGFSQPAITYQMKNLERAVGTPLLVRAGRGLRLTPAGKVILGHADRVLAALRATETEAASLREAGTGLIRLASFQTACATLVPHAIAAVRRSHPAVEFDLIQTEPETALAMVRHGDVDLALTYTFEGGRRPRPRAGPDDPLRQVEVMREPMLLVVPADHETPKPDRLTLRDVAQETFVLSALLEPQLRRSAAALDFTPSKVMVNDDYMTCQALVAAGLGVSVVSRLAMSAHRHPRVRAEPIPGWPRRRIMVEMWPEMLAIDLVRTFVDALVSAGSAAQAGDHRQRSRQEAVPGPR